MEAAVKSAEERIDSLERAVRWYRLLFLAALILIFATQRYRITAWLDTAEGWLDSLTTRSSRDW
jgi:hypothetical protein